MRDSIVAKLFVSIALLLLAGCEGGVSVDIRGPTIGFAAVMPEPFVAVGTNTLDGGLRVNGIAFDTSGASIVINGATASVEGLDIGQYARIRDPGLTPGEAGFAAEVVIDSNVIGVVESIDRSAGILTTLGQTVSWSSDTEFGHGIDPATLAGIAMGTRIEVHGYTTSNDGIAATRIEISNSVNLAQLVGRARNLDVGNLLFTVGNVEVVYASASVIELPGGAPTEGQFVVARGQYLDDGSLQATSLSAFESALPRFYREPASVEGLVTRMEAGAVVEVAGLPVRVDTDTRVINGVSSDINPDDRVRVYGRTELDGRTIDLDEIELNP